MGSYVFMSDGTTKPFDGLELGDVLEGGGVVASLHPVFRVSNNKVHIYRQSSPFDTTRFEHEFISLSRHPRVVVYTENFPDHPYYEPLMIYEGNTLLGLLTEIHECLEALVGISDGEYCPDIQIYNKRQGRHQIGPVLPNECEEVYVLLR